MIFDHAVAGTPEDRYYTIQVVPEGDLRNNLVIHQPSLLMAAPAFVQDYLHTLFDLSLPREDPDEIDDEAARATP